MPGLWRTHIWAGRAGAVQFACAIYGHASIAERGDLASYGTDVGEFSLRTPITSL